MSVVLVTGGSGFIGVAVVRQLRARGDTIRGMARAELGYAARPSSLPHMRTAIL